MAEDKEYLVRGAMLFCDCGNSPNFLDLPRDHGVYTKGELPMVHEDDNKVGVNIKGFGICSSAEGPTTAPQIMKIQVPDEAGNMVDADIEGIACSPIITQSWKEPHETVYIEDGGAKKRALTTESFLVCQYGGRITPVTSGQENA